MRALMDAATKAFLISVGTVELEQPYSSAQEIVWLV